MTSKQATPMAGNIFFGVLMVVMTIYFVIWGLDYTNYQQMTVFFLAAFFGIFMAFNMGGNDVANSFGTSVGAGTLTVTQALLIAAVFEVSGAVLAGGVVTDTIRKGIVDLDNVPVEPMQLVFIMMSALIAASFWILFATKKALPVSATHSLIGGLVGGSILLGFNAGGIDFAFSTVKWAKVGSIAISWVLSPLLGAMLSYAVYGLIKKYILSYNDATEIKIKALKSRKKDIKKQQRKHFESLPENEQLTYTASLLRDQELFKENDCTREELETQYYQDLFDLQHERESLDTLKALRTYVPLIAALGSAVMTSLVVFKGLSKTDYKLSHLSTIFVICIISAIIYLAVFIYTKMIRGKHKEDLGKATFILFSWMQVFTASAFAFSHGSNDIANAIGPFIAIFDVIRTGTIGAATGIPTPVMLTFGVALIVGLWFVGKEVIQTVGTDLAKMHPASGFSAEMSAAAVVVGASALGLPVSSTHILVGAVLGIGMVNRDTNWQLMKPIGLAWVITLPASIIMSALAYLALNAIF